MLLRISLIIAIIAGLGAGALSYIQATDKIPALIAQRDKENTDKKSEMAAHTKTKGELKKTAAELVTTQGKLTDTEGERDKALAKADDAVKKLDTANANLAKTKEERDAAQGERDAYKASGLTPDQAAKLNRTLKDRDAQIQTLKFDNTVLTRTLAKTKTELDKFIAVDPTIKLRADLRGKILVVDPKWDFVVLDIGEDQGVISDGELLVSRSGKLVAKVVVRSVQRDRCIANIMPGWKLGDPVEGDEVSPAHPAS